MPDYAIARRNMVENQLRPSRIDDPRLLEAMGTVPRELFVPPHLRSVAYGDSDLVLGGGRFLLEPLALAKLLQTAGLQPAETAMVIGDGTGYAAAVTARLVEKVVLLLAPGDDRSAVEAVLRGQDAADVTVVQGDGPAGHAAGAPYDAIVLVGAVPAVPKSLLDQLTDQGRLVAVVEKGRDGKVTVFEKVGEAVGRISPFDAGVPRLPGFEPAPSFTF